MTHKQFIGLTVSSAVLCGAMAWFSFSDKPAGQPPASGLLDRTTPVLFALPAVEDETDKTAPTINKRKKTVTGKNDSQVEYNKLSPEEVHVILRKGTERAFTGEYTDTKDPGTYICKRCNAALYHSETKFESHCGWPSFDDEIKGAVKHRRETDGTGRTEIVCANCGGHLGHVFRNEGYTAKNTRHCVNSISMRFVAQGKPLPEVIKPKEASRIKVNEKSASAKDATSPEDTAATKAPAEKTK